MIRKIIKNILFLSSLILNKKVFRRPDFSEKKIFLQGQLMAKKNEDKKNIISLKDVEFSVFSQFGEDGIINWLISKLPNLNKVFLEIGTEDYWESNTRFLLKNNNWKGYLIEASKEHVANIKKQQIYWKHNIKAIQSLVDKDNINDLIKENISEKEIGLLSIDIDGIDYWVIENISDLSPAIVICEFNSIYGDLKEFTVPYDKFFVRNKKHHSNLYFGCSIKAIIKLMSKKNYTFIGTGSMGINAYFIKNELKSLVVNNIKKIDTYPSFCREARDKEGNLTFQNINENLKEIENLDILDLELNEIKKLSEYKNLFSQNWKKYLEY